MSSQSQGTASQHSLISKAYHSLTPIFCPRGGGLGKRGLHCFASCLAAAPLRGARCRPGSERVQAAGRDKGLGGGARLPRCFPQSLARSLGRSGGPGPGPVKPPIPEAAASTPQLGATWAPPSPHSPPQTEGHPALPPCAPELAKGARAPLPAPPGRPPLLGAELRGAAGDRSRESGPPLPGDSGGGGAGGPRRPPAFPARARPAAPAGPGRPRAAAPAAPRSPAAGARPAGSRSGDAASSGPGPVRAGAQRGAAQRSAAPRSRASRAERELPAGGSGDKRPAFLAAAGRASRTGHVGTGRCSGSALSASERPRLELLCARGAGGRWARPGPARCPPG